MYDTLAVLVTEEYTPSQFGEQLPTESYKNIWAEQKSVQQSEWFNAGQQGLQPAMVLKTPVENYGGEKIAIVEGKKYGIYRTYERGHDIELYLEQQGGI